MNKIIRDWASRKEGEASDGAVHRDGDILMCDWGNYHEYKNFVIAAFAPAIGDEDVLLLRHADDCPAHCAAIRDEAEAAAAHHSLLPLYCKNPAAETDEEHAENAVTLIKQIFLGGGEEPDNVYLYCHMFGIDIPVVHFRGEELSLPPIGEKA